MLINYCQEECHFRNLGTTRAPDLVMPRSAVPVAVQHRNLEPPPGTGTDVTGWQAGGSLSPLRVCFGQALPLIAPGLMMVWRKCG